MSADRPTAGFALIATIVALSLLMTLMTPFLLSMGHGDAASQQLLDDKQVELLSASIRDLALNQASQSHGSVDPDPLVDGLAEFPGPVALPQAFEALERDGLNRHQLSAEVRDVQRLINLDSVSPLVLANLLGLVAHVSQDVDPEADEIPVDDASDFPEEGYIVVDRELIHYGSRDGNAFSDLEREQLTEMGYRVAEDHPLARDTLVLDFRVVLAVMHSFYHREGGERKQRQPFASVDEIAGIASLGFGGFSPAQLDVLRAHCTVSSARETAGELSAADFGRAERVFAIDGNQAQDLELIVRDGANMGAGSVVRIRDQDGTKSEYALVWSTRVTGTGGVNLPQPRYALQLLLPLANDFEEFETLVEPVLPHAVNINTASTGTLAALIANVRIGTGPRPHGQGPPRPFRLQEARQVADELRAMRGDTDVVEAVEGGFFAGVEVRPFDGVEDLVLRFFKPRLEDLEERARARWQLLYRSLLGGNVVDLQMRTGPISFTSAPLVEYRAAVARRRGDRLAARMERRGLAVAMPSDSLACVVANQALFEEAVRLDRRLPFYQTLPINMMSFSPFTPAANPPSRAFAHLLPLVAPNLGFGQARFPSRDGTGDGVRLTPGFTPAGYRNNITAFAQESMWGAFHPEGRDVVQEGPYSMFNRGPRQAGGTAPAPPSSGPQAHRPTFPYTAQGSAGLVSRHAVGFWFMPRDTGDQMLFDLSAAGALRNRISVQIRGGDLVFEVLDEAGLDPDPSRNLQQASSPNRTAGTWKVPLNQINLQANVWYHVSLAASGNRPGQLTMLVDGVPRGQPQLRTYLAQRVQSYTRRSMTPFWSNNEKYLDLIVEDTKGFPPQGVLRIGLELFEYSSLTATSFRCAFGNSIGGRTARMSLREFSPQIPLDGNGRPTVNPANIGTGVNLDVAPEHEVGSAVELYGYTVPVYRNSVVQIGSGRLASGLGAFSVARLINSQNLKPIGQGPVFFGRGLDVSYNNNLELGDPHPLPSGQNYPPKQASDPVLSGFSKNGGYALLIQNRIQVNVTAGPSAGVIVVVGGIELIRYGGRQGNKLTGVQRGLAHPRNDKDQSGLFTGSANNYVLDWNPSLFAGGKVTPNELESLVPYVVPISIEVQGNLMDPSVLGRSEWLQLYPGLGNEAQTEWVRYDYLQGSHVMRVALAAWRNTHQVLTNQAAVSSFSLQPPSLLPQPADAARGLIQQQRSDYIGYVDRIEVDHPVIQLVRRVLGFRGDPLTGTTSHAQSSSTVVLPVHRFELDWGNYGARSGRVGRTDRVALVAGSQASGVQRPAVDWHTVNWSARNFNADQGSAGAGGNPGTAKELLGSYPCQLVGFKSPVTQLFIGPANRDFRQDTRLIDRLVKFPSGELPAAAPENGVFGSTPQGDVPNLRGVIDDLLVVARRSPPLLLDQSMNTSAQQFTVRVNLLITPQGDLAINGDLSSQTPVNGGLVAIDGEIMAYRSHAAGVFQVAQNGRGLLGTQPRQHDEGALVYFLDHVPAAILSSPVGQSSNQLVVNDLGDLPRYGGTLLLGRSELLHYTWTVGQQLLEMPQWFDPQADDSGGRGLLRGRYGTTPIAVGAGEPVILFPFRYWDREHERAEDPELAQYQITWNAAPVFFKGLYWEEENGNPLVDLQCLVRLDGHGSFADDPAEQPSLFHFVDGDVQGQPNRIARQGTRLEARFKTVYRPGAFNPQTFAAQAWKRAPTLRAFMLEYEGEGRVLWEQVTAR